MSVVDISSLFRRSHNFQWYWNSKADPSSYNDKWMKYTDIENEIIEDAFDTHRKEVEIDGGYIIDLAQLVQYSNMNNNTRQQIKRIASDSKTTANIHLREERFSSPISLVSTSPDKTIENKEKNKIRLQLLRGTVHFPSSYLWFITSRNATFADIVEEAAHGIMKEGTDIGKKREAEWLASKLLSVKHYGEGIDRLHDDGIPGEIGRMCVLLYTTDSFLFKSINCVLRDTENIT
ncbi:unnamed protein product, partial [Rotaria sordida]